jgi:hypothetical protein
MSAPPVLPCGSHLPVGPRGTRIPNLDVLLAVFAARQALNPTARHMRDAGMANVINSQADRMTEIFAPKLASASVQRSAKGAFHRAVAARLAMGTEGKSYVYSDA